MVSHVSSLAWDGPNVLRGCGTVWEEAIFLASLHLPLSLPDTHPLGTFETKMAAR